VIPEEYIYKTKPAWVFLTLMLAVGLFCMWMTYFSWTASWKSSNGTSEATVFVFKTVFTAFIFIFGSICLSMVLGMKICYLTETELIVKRPLLFFQRVVQRADIRSITEKDSKIDINNKSFSREWVKIGDTAVLLLKTGKKIELSSVNVGGYAELIKKLRYRYAR